MIEKVSYRDWYPGRKVFRDGGKLEQQWTRYLRPQRGGRVYALKPHPHIPHRWRVLGKTNSYYATRAQAAQAAREEGRKTNIIAPNTSWIEDGMNTTVSGSERDRSAV